MLRTRGKDKKKETFNKYGKNTSRGMRFKLAHVHSSEQSSSKPTPGKSPATDKNCTGKYGK